MSTLKEKTAQGLFWGAANNLITQIFSLLIGIVLARLLVPKDYGLVGMLTIFTALAGTIQDSGFTSALANRRNIKEEDYTSVFWFCSTVSLLIYCILFLLAPLIARFYHHEELITLSRLVFASLLISGFGIAHNAYMFRNLMNKEKAILNTFASILSGCIGIFLAWRGFAYWSLAWQQFVYITTICIGRLYFVRWMPSLRFSFRPIKEMFGFSSKVVLSTIVSQVSTNLLTVIFGRLFSAHAVGNYTQAAKWQSYPCYFVFGTVNQVAQPVMASVSDDRKRHLRVFRKMLRLTAFISFPILWGLFTVSREFILFTIGDKWSDSVVLLRILCIGGAFMPLYSLFQYMMLSLGRSGINLRCNIAFTVVQAILIFAFHSMGIKVMVIVFTIANVLWFIVWQIITKRLIGLRLMDSLFDILPFAGVSIIACGIAYVSTIGISILWLVLLLRVVLASAIYFGIMKVFKAKILDDVISFFLRK